MADLKTYQAADQAWYAAVKLSPFEREQLFRLKGYLEGVGAPKEMKEVYDGLLRVVLRG